MPTLKMRAAPTDGREIMSPHSKTELEGFCSRFNIPIEHLADILRDPQIARVVQKKARSLAAKEINGDSKNAPKVSSVQ